MNIQLLINLFSGVLFVVAIPQRTAAAALGSFSNGFQETCSFE